jgi:sugar lactone lactonase YvrE
MVFAAGAGATASPVRTIVGTNTLLESPLTLAVDAAGDLYVGQLVGDVLEFAAGASGNVAPMRTLRAMGATNTGIGGVLGMGVDAGGSLYIANDMANVSDILVFAPSANGDVAPIRRIAGSATEMIGNTVGVTVDAAGNIYVSTESITPAFEAVLEFAAGANGNVAPIREITGSNTTLTGNVSNPVLDSSGNLYVLVYPGGMANLVKFAPDANGNVVPTAVSTSGTGINSFQIALH